MDKVREANLACVRAGEGRIADSCGSVLILLSDPANNNDSMGVYTYFFLILQTTTTQWRLDTATT